MNRKVIFCFLVGFLLFLGYESADALEDWDNMGVYGGQTAEIVFDAFNGLVYSRIITPAGIYKADIGAGGWIKLDSFPNPSEAAAMGVTQTNGYIFVATSGYLYYSTNKGANWNAISDVNNGSAICVTSGNVLYVGATDPANPSLLNILKSEDYGATWSAILDSGLSISSFQSIAVSADGNTLWATIPNSGTVYRFTQSGGTWTQASFDLTATVTSFVSNNVAMIPNDSSKVYFAGTKNESLRLIKTTNGTQITPTFSKVVSVLSGNDSSKAYLNENTATIYLGAKESSDGGTSWDDLPDPTGGSSNLYVIGLHPTDDDIIYTRTDWGLACSEDVGTSFQEINNGMNAVLMFGAIQHPTNSSILIAVSESGITRSTDSGATWSFVHFGSFRSIATDSTGAYIYAGDTSGDVFVSADNGVTWTTTGLGIKVAAELGTARVHKLFVDPVNENIIYAALATYTYTDGKLYKGTRAGGGSHSWTGILSSIPAASVHAYDNSGTAVILVGYGDKRGNTGTKGLKRSINAGGSFVDVSDLDGFIPYCIKADPNNDLNLFIGTGHIRTSSETDQSGTVFKSTDGGANWTNTQPNNGNVGMFRDIAVDPDNSSKVYAACRNVIYQSVDAGSNWEKFYESAAGERFYVLFMFAGVGDLSDYSLITGTEEGFFLWGASKTWYFAEGYTGGDFVSYLLIENPTSAQANVTATYYKTNGTTVEEIYPIAAGTRKTVGLNGISELENSEFATKLVSDKSVIAERAVYWNDGKTGHSTIGLTDLSTIWYLAEGSTANDFQEYLVLGNPSTSTANIAVKSYGTSGLLDTYTTTLEGQRRKTINLNVQVADQASVSSIIEADIPIVAERVMYKDNFGKGHCSSAVTSISEEWFFAEGSNVNYTTWFVVFNPNSTAATVTASFSTIAGVTVAESFTVPAYSRYTLDSSAVAGVSDTHFSTKISCDGNQILAERSMYWGTDGHCTIGCKTLTTKWYFAEGSTQQDKNYNTWICLYNPAAADTADATVAITYYKQDSTSVTGTYTVEAHSRANVKVNDVSGLEDVTGVAMFISSDLPIAAERAMYFENSGGHVTRGYSG